MNNLLNRIEALVARHEELETLITDPNVIADGRRFATLSKEYTHLGEILKAGEQYKQLLTQQEEAESTLQDNDSDEELKAAVLSATNKLIENKDEILNSFQEIVGGVYDTHTLEGEKAKLESEMDVCAKMIEDLIRQNAAILQDQSEYQAKYEDLERFYDEKQAALAKAEGKLKKMQTTKADIEFS